MADKTAAVLVDELSALLPNKVLLPGTAEYASRVDSYFFRTARQTPACIVTPESPKEVHSIVKLLEAHPSVKFAIRSGGHTPNPQHSNVDDGITIDLGAFRQIEETEGYDDVLSVGAGALWGDVYAYLEPKKKSVVGARESSVGVGGFLTGGGLSFFAPSLGFGCDNIVRMQVVTPTGIFLASSGSESDEHADLFQALRGGQGNFGIVTRFDIRTHDRDRYWGGGMHYPESTEDAQLRAWAELKGTGKGKRYDPDAAVLQSYLYFGEKQAFCFSNMMVYLQPTEHPEGLKPFADIEPDIPGTNTMRLDTTRNFSLELQRWQPRDQFAIYATLTIKFTPSLGRQLNALWRTATVSISDSPNITSVLTYQGFPPQFPDNPNGMFPDPSYTSELHKSHLILIFSVYWHVAEDSKRITRVAQQLISDMEKAAEEVGCLHEFKYPNYAAWWQRPYGCGEEGAWDGKGRMARGVREKYDPEGVFGRQGVGFKFE